MSCKLDKTFSIELKFPYTSHHMLCRCEISTAHGFSSSSYRSLVINLAQQRRIWSFSSERDGLVESNLGAGVYGGGGCG